MFFHRHGLSPSTTAHPHRGADQRWPQVLCYKLFVFTFFPSSRESQYVTPSSCCHAFYTWSFFYEGASHSPPPPLFSPQWYSVRWSKPSQFLKMLQGWRKLEKVPVMTWGKCCSWCCLWPLRSNKRLSKPMASTMKERVRIRPHVCLFILLHFG